MVRPTWDGTGCSPSFRSMKSLVFLLLALSPEVVSKQDNFQLTLLLPNVVVRMNDELICTGTKLGPEEMYIVKFTPHASRLRAHHLMVYGCPQIANHNPSWTCMGSDLQGSEDAVCAGTERQILFAWALDAPEKSLPTDVGLRVSGATDIKYIVIQLHFVKPFEANETDHSGITLEMTYRKPAQQVGYLVLGNMGFIPPRKKEIHLDSSCTYVANYTIYPIGYRTHSHNLGIVTSGYRIRDGKWLEIGRMSPRLPETFYPVTHPGMDIRNGDKLAARCTMNSMSRSSITHMGPTNHDEMCNFYIMYSTYEQSILSTTYCFNDAPSYSWLQDFKEEDIPANAGSLQGIPGTEEVLREFHLL